MALELDEITLNGEKKKISEIPELQAYVQNVRAEAHKAEKEKLYTRISELENGIKRLEAIPIVTTPTQQVQNSQAPQIDTNSIIAGVIDALLPKLEASLDAKLKDVVVPITKETQFLKEANLNTYRLKLIEENQGKCIPEYVVGNSKEELDAALLKSVELFSKYLPKKEVAPVITSPNTELAQKETVVKQEVVEEVTKETPKIVEPPKKQVVNNPEIEDIKGLTPDQFKKNRDALRESMRTLLPS